MKFIRDLIIFVLVCFSASAIAAPVAPKITYNIEYYPDGPTVAILWDSVPGATKYKLLYAPIPYTGPDSIGSIDVEPVGDKSYYYAEFSHEEIPKGASYYIAVQAGDDTGFSGYSNIESVIILARGESINVAGNWTVSGNISSYPTSTCNTILAGEINGIAAINQLQDSVTMTLPIGISLSGSIVEDELNVIGYRSDQIIEISFSLARDNRNMRGVGVIGNSLECGGMINLSLSR